MERRKEGRNSEDISVTLGKETETETKRERGKEDKSENSRYITVSVYEESPWRLRHCDPEVFERQLVVSQEHQTLLSQRCFKADIWYSVQLFYISLQSLTSSTFLCPLCSLCCLCFARVRLVPQILVFWLVEQEHLPACLPAQVERNYFKREQQSETKLFLSLLVSGICDSSRLSGQSCPCSASQLSLPLSRALLFLTGFSNLPK